MTNPMQEQGLMASSSSVTQERFGLTHVEPPTINTLPDPRKLVIILREQVENIGRSICNHLISEGVALKDIDGEKISTFAQKFSFKLFVFLAPVGDCYQFNRCRAVNNVLADPEFDPEPGTDIWVGLCNDMKNNGLHMLDPKFEQLGFAPQVDNITISKVLRAIPSIHMRSGYDGPEEKGPWSAVSLIGEAYEYFMNYRGRVPTEDLYEVNRPGVKLKDLDPCYLVNAQDLEAYREEERVYETVNGQKVLKKHAAGSFIYRMAGRDRERSASYYTPESLTQCLVKYTLKERLQDEDGTPMKADDILKLSVCEPAMGSAAFLNEAVNQLAEAYLQRKQEEIGERIPHEDYAQELQRVKMHIADHNCYGVDLNATAVELAEVSLWLNAIHGTDQVPWFGYQLFAGNSLIGARRQVYDVKRLKAGKNKNQLWYNHAPTRLDPRGLAGHEEGLRKNSQVYHFLLPDPGMAHYRDKVIKKLRPTEIATINAWRKSFCDKPMDAAHIRKLKKLSQHIDTVWAEHVAILRQDRLDTEDPLPVWPNKDDGARVRSSTREKDRRRLEGLFNHDKPLTSPLMRLKLVMDLWCSLWFWPIDKADLLPSRDQFFHACYLLLGFDRHEVVQIQEDLFAVEEDNLLDLRHSDLTQDVPLSALDGNLAEVDREMSLAKICQKLPMMKVVLEQTKAHCFHHWELVFADIFANFGGFDIILGNPPWLLVTWNEGGLMGELNPIMVLRKLSAKQMTDSREETFRHFGDQPYTHEYCSTASISNFLKAESNYSLLAGMKANLYKCFLPQSWMLGNIKASIGLIHPEGVYDDPRGGRLRSELYPALRHHYQFINAKNLFKDIDGMNKFSLNVYQPAQKTISANSISNLVQPGTIDACWHHNGHGQPEGIKTEKGQWSVAGHRSRIIEINKVNLSLFADLYDEVGTSWHQARLPQIHIRQLLPLLQKLAAYPNRLSQLVSNKEIFTSDCWNETQAQKEGIIERQTHQPNSTDRWIVSGPNFFSGNPFYKTPMENCKSNSDYYVINLFDIPSNYIPRSNYTLAREDHNLKDKSRKNLLSTIKNANNYRIFIRAMLSPTIERTLISAIFPKRCTHINSVKSLHTKNLPRLATIANTMSALSSDFFIKTTGKANLHSLWYNLPLTKTSPKRILRALLSHCITQDYAELWRVCWDDRFLNDRWASDSQTLRQGHFQRLGPDWKHEYPSRSDFERRQLQLEMDVLEAMEIGWSLYDLITAYETQFFVLQQNERGTYYDQNGKIVFTTNKGLLGVGLSKSVVKDGLPSLLQFSDGSSEQRVVGWEDVKYIKGLSKLTCYVSSEKPNASSYLHEYSYFPPFFSCDRAKDYAEIWHGFESRRS